MQRVMALNRKKLSGVSTSSRGDHISLNSRSSCRYSAQMRSGRDGPAGRRRFGRRASQVRGEDEYEDGDEEEEEKEEDGDEEEDGEPDWREPGEGREICSQP